VLRRAEEGVHRLQLARAWRLPLRLGHRQFHLVQKANRVVCRPGQPRHPPDRQLAHRLRRLNEVSGQDDPADGLSPERQPAPQVDKRLCNPSARRRHHQNAVGRKAGSVRPRELDRPAVPSTLQSKVAVKLSELDPVEHHRQPAPVRRSGAAARSEDNPATASLPRLLRVRVLGKREAAKSVDNLESIDLRPHRQRGQVPAKPEVEEREDKLLNLAGSQEVGRQLRLSRGRGSRSGQRKKEKRLHHRDHNKSCFCSGSGMKKFRSRFV
jgi:hypothetical protein